MYRVLKKKKMPAKTLLCDYIILMTGLVDFLFFFFFYFHFLI